MRITILDYIVKESGSKKGVVDFKVTYDATRSETFRGFSYFEKEDKKWIAPANTLRNEQWLPYYERTPEISKAILSEALDALKQYLINLEPSALAENDSEPLPDMF